MLNIDSKYLRNILIVSSCLLILQLSIIIAHYCFFEQHLYWPWLLKLLALIALISALLYRSELIYYFTTVRLNIPQIKLFFEIAHVADERRI